MCQNRKKPNSSLWKSNVASLVWYKKCIDVATSKWLPAGIASGSPSPMIPLDTQEGEKQKGENMGEEVGTWDKKFWGWRWLSEGSVLAGSFVGDKVFVHPHLDGATI